MAIHQNPGIPTAISKVPEVTFAFWLIKIFATTLGETGGDALSMTLKLGYAVSTGIFFAFFVGTAAAQIKATAYHPLLYWAVIVATTTVGTTMSDYLTRTAGLGYPGASAVLFVGLMIILGIWHFTLGTVSVAHVAGVKVETFYWAAILVSNTLGTALGDALADAPGFGFVNGALTFAGALALIACAYWFTKISHTALFWAAFILTRPLGATLGDVLTKPVDDGGLNLSRPISSLVIGAAMIAAILFASRNAARQKDQPA